MFVIESRCSFPFGLRAYCSCLLACDFCRYSACIFGFLTVFSCLFGPISCLRLLLLSCICLCIRCRILSCHLFDCDLLKTNCLVSVRPQHGFRITQSPRGAHRSHYTRRRRGKVSLFPRFVSKGMRARASPKRQPQLARSPAFCWLDRTPGQPPVPPADVSPTREEPPYLSFVLQRDMVGRPH